MFIAFINSLSLGSACWVLGGICCNNLTTSANNSNNYFGVRYHTIICGAFNFLAKNFSLIKRRNAVMTFIDIIWTF